MLDKEVAEYWSHWLWKDKQWYCCLSPSVLWCNWVVFCFFFYVFVAAWQRLSMKVGRGKKATSIRGLVCSDYKWLPPAPSCPAAQIVTKNTERRFLYSPRPESESSRPDAAGHSDAAESLEGTGKKKKRCFSSSIDKLRCLMGGGQIMSSSFVSVWSGRIFWCWPHVGTM